MHKDFVAFDIRRHNLSSDISIAEADDETVFGCRELVFSRRNQVPAGLIVGLASATAFVLGLKATIICVRATT